MHLLHSIYILLENLKKFETRQNSQSLRFAFEVMARSCMNSHAFIGTSRCKQIVETRSNNYVARHFTDGNDYKPGKPCLHEHTHHWFSLKHHCRS